MNVSRIAGLAVSFSIVLAVPGSGLRTSLSYATSLFRECGLLLRPVLATNVAMPIVVVSIIAPHQDTGSR